MVCKAAGRATSARDGMVLIGTLVFWSYMLDFMSFKFPVAQHLTAAPRLCLVRDGKLLRNNMRREFIIFDLQSSAPALRPRRHRRSKLTSGCRAGSAVLNGSTAGLRKPLASVDTPL